MLTISLDEIRLANGRAKFAGMHVRAQWINFFGVWILTDPPLFTRVGVRVGPLTVGPAS